MAVKASFTISLARVDDGTPGTPGADGKTSFLHIKYSDDGQTFTDNNGETLGAYIGTLVDFTEADSNNFGDYTWKKFTEDVDDELALIHQKFIDEQTNIIESCNSIIMSALTTCVETGNYEEFKQTVEAQLQILSSSITMKFDTATESINKVNGDLQAEITQRQKHITFSEDGITIGAGENAMQLKLDNEKISFMKDGVQFGWWDGNNFHTGNIEIEVNEKAKFGNFAFEPLGDGSLMFSKVGG